MAKITFDLRMFQSSGIGTYLQNLAPPLIASLPEHYFTLLGDPQVLQGKFSANSEIVKFTAPIYSFQEQLGMSRLIPKGTALFWSPHYNIPLWTHTKRLVTVHDLNHLALPQYNFLKTLYAKFFFAFIARHANAIVCVSEFTKSEFSKYYPRARPRIVTIHNGVNQSWFQVRKGKNPHPRPFLLYVGNIKPHKNLRKLIRAFQSIESIIEQDLVIVGKKAGFLTEDKILLKEISSFKRVNFTGFVDIITLEQYFAFADLLVMPSYYEGFGLPALEAMAVGCPVIAAKTSSLPEVCGNAALYFDPNVAEDIAEKILSILSNSSLRERLSREGKEQAKKFTWENCLVQMRSVLLETL